MANYCCLEYCFPLINAELRKKEQIAYRIKLRNKKIYKDLHFYCQTNFATLVLLGPKKQLSNAWDFFY